MTYQNGGQMRPSQDAGKIAVEFVKGHYTNPAFLNLTPVKSGS
jgi:hypothetical protein